MRKRATKVKEDYFELPEGYSGKFISTPQTETKLLSCTKSGVWRKSRGRRHQRYRWTSDFEHYFKQLPVTNESHTVIGNFLEKVTLFEFKDVKCVPRKKESLSLNKFSMKIIKNNDISSKEMSKVFFAVAAGGDSFQHFVQDLAPILAFYKPFLDAHPDMQLALKEPLFSFKSFEILINSLHIKNDLILIKPKTSIEVSSLYVPSFSSMDALYSTPVSMYIALRELIRNDVQVEKSSSPTILLVLRKEETRNMINVQEVELALRDWSNQRGHCFHTVDTKIESPQAVKRKFQEAKIIIAMHGGANYNLIFSQPHTVFIEFIPTINTNTMADFALSIGIDYLPIPVEGSISNRFFQVPLDKLLNLLNHVTKH